MSGNQHNAQTPSEDARFWLAAMAESSDDAIIGKDLNGLITSWNRAAERMFGFVADEIVGQSITRIVPPDRIEEEASIRDRIQCGERIVRFITELQCKDGVDLFPIIIGPPGSSLAQLTNTGLRPKYGATHSLRACQASVHLGAKAQL